MALFKASSDISPPSCTIPGASLFSFQEEYDIDLVRILVMMHILLPSMASTLALDVSLVVPTGISLIRKRFVIHAICHSALPP